MMNIQQSLFALLLLVAVPAWALNGVHPTGVNVRATGPTTVFLTFQGTAGQRSTQAMWCGEISVAPNQVVDFNPCVPGTLLGNLPKRLDQSRASGTQGQSNTTDIMTIPASVARKAFQAAQRGEKSSFFYVRRFDGPTGPQYVAVTCRLAGGGARVPLALLKVEPMFLTGQGSQPVQLLAQGQEAPPVSAQIFYNGSGRLKGRWEIVRPGDIEPTEFDLLPEASLPVEKRGLQQRYEVLSRFDINLPPTGRVVLDGPSSRLLPNRVIGPYQLLLRIEATRDKEGNSNTSAGTAFTGGVAGFAMPALKYYVGEAAEVLEARVDAGLARQSQIILQIPEGTRFSWQSPDTAQPIAYFEYRLYEAGQLVHTAILTEQTFYIPPPWLFEQADQQRFEWQVAGVDAKQQVVAISQRRALMLPVQH